MVLDHLSRALEQTADSVVITNRDGIIEYVNPAFEAMAGFSRAEAIGRTPSLVRSGAQTPHLYATLWSTILSGRPFHTVLTNRRRDGRLFDEEQTITPLRDEDGAITHFVSTGRDVTEARRCDAARLHHQLEQEASRVAALLHAETGQFLTSAHLTLSDVARTVSPDVRLRLDEVRRSLDRVEQLLRLVARGMQPRVIADLGLIDAIRFLADGCTRRTGVAVAVESTLDRRSTAAVETLIYRFVQETLAHLPRVPGPASVTVMLRREVHGRRSRDETVRCQISGDGAAVVIADALKADRDGSGLRLVRERFEAVGGSLTVVTEDGVPGLRATVPLRA